MLRSSRLMAIPVIAAGLLLAANASEAQAQVRVQIGGFGIRGGSVYRGGHHFSPRHVYGHSVHRPSYGVRVYGHHVPRVHGYGHHGYYHDTTHLDYHPPTFYRHGNHYDFQPGHYDVHHSGHYHH